MQKDDAVHVVCAAIKLEHGEIICGARHYDMVMVGVLERMDVLEPAAVQGFIDQRGNFLTREEAYAAVSKTGQVQTFHTPGTLYSEDLY